MPELLPTDPLLRATIRREEGWVIGLYVPPGDRSGVTANPGIDFGQHTAEQIGRDWAGHVSATVLPRLRQLAGLKGMAARQALRSVADIRLSDEACWAVFGEQMFPRYCKDLDKDFPGWRALALPIQVALFDLDWNRGGLPTLSNLPTDGGSSDTDRYDCERRIRQAVAEPDQEDIARVFRIMAEDGPGTLWPGPTAPNPNLRGRCLRRAQLVESTYPKGNHA